MKNLKNKKGFTIVELVIVIAVIAILAAVLIPTFGGVIEKANASAAMQEARNIYTEYVSSDVYDTKVEVEYVLVGTKYYSVNKWEEVTPSGTAGTDYDYIEKTNEGFKLNNALLGDDSE